MILLSFLSSIVNLSGTGDLILTIISFLSVFWWFVSFPFNQQHVFQLGNVCHGAGHVEPEALDCIPDRAVVHGICYFGTLQWR